jgi:DNA-binding response OmpR family regulator
MCASTGSQLIPACSFRSVLGKRPVILIIDDEPVIAQSLTFLLEPLGLEVIAAESGERGIAYFLQRAPAVTLVDILMPVQDGIETILKMRRHRASAKIIAMSGGGQIAGMHYLAMAVKVGADLALEKPIDCDQLLIALRTLLPGDPVAVMRRDEPTHRRVAGPPVCDANQPASHHRRAISGAKLVR